MDAELELIELQICELLQKQAELTCRKDALLQRLKEACNAAQPSSSKLSGANPVLSKQELQLYDGTGTLHSIYISYMHCNQEISYTSPRAGVPNRLIAKAVPVALACHCKKNWFPHFWQMRGSLFFLISM